MLTFLHKAIPHDLPISRKLWLLLSSVELLLSVSVCWFISSCSFLTGAFVYGHLKYQCWAQGWLSMAVFFIYPIALLISPWKRLFVLSRCAMLVMGVLSIFVGVAILIPQSINPDPIMKAFLYIEKPVEVQWLIFPVILGFGCLLRYYCANRYAHCFYLAALIWTYHKNRRDFVILVRILIFYTAIYLVICAVLYFSNAGLHL